jgi:hypothetical protein
MGYRESNIGSRQGAHRVGTTAPTAKMTISCCGARWIGVDRAHCCRRTGGCGRVFDDAVLWDRHRRYRRCLDPRSVSMIRSAEGIWLRSIEQPPARRARRTRSPTRS